MKTNLGFFSNENYVPYLIVQIFCIWLDNAELTRIMDIIVQVSEVASGLLVSNKHSVCKHSVCYNYTFSFIYNQTSKNKKKTQKFVFWYENFISFARKAYINNKTYNYTEELNYLMWPMVTIVKPFIFYFYWCVWNKWKIRLV